MGPFGKTLRGKERRSTMTTDPYVNDETPLAVQIYARLREEGQRLSRVLDPEDLRQRVGRFTIATSLVEEHPDDITLALAEAGILVVRCEHDWGARCFRYTALCHLFRPNPEYAKPPEYTLWLRKEDSGRPRFDGITPGFATLGERNDSQP